MPSFHLFPDLTVFSSLRALDTAENHVFALPPPVFSWYNSQKQLLYR